MVLCMELVNDFVICHGFIRFGKTVSSVLLGAYDTFVNSK